MRLALRSLTALAAIIAVACGSSGKNPTGPSTTATVSAITVTGVSTSATTFQLTATAQLSDGTSQNVTSSSAWSSSNGLVATVSGGLVTVLASGDVDIRATYQNVSGSMHLLVARVPVTSVSVIGGAAIGNFQLTATARLSDGSVLDVTRSASWESSNPLVVTVNANGFATVLTSGEADVRATYQGVSGSQRVTVAPPRSYALSGVVTEVAPNARPVANAVVRILGGGVPSVTTNEQGAFRFSSVPQGRVLVEVSKDGYLAWEGDETITNGDATVDATVYPTPPKNADGISATARCNDGTWSWSIVKNEVCSANGGVAYFVCPGAACSTTAR